jgi:toxin ParE1/3/4
MDKFMKTIWTNLASESLKEIYDYYKTVASINIAKKIKDAIFFNVKQLIQHPKSGQIEPTLLQLGEDHRYLIGNNYKVVYKIVEEGILITDVFDIRQDPLKLGDPKRKNT